MTRNRADCSVHEESCFADYLSEHAHTPLLTAEDLKREPSEQELAEELGIGLDQLKSFVDHTRAHRRNPTRTISGLVTEPAQPFSFEYERRHFSQRFDFCAYL